MLRFLHALDSHGAPQFRAGRVPACMRRCCSCRTATWRRVVGPDHAATSREWRARVAGRHRAGHSEFSQRHVDGARIGFRSLQRQELVRLGRGQPRDQAHGVLFRRQGIELLHGRPGQLDVELVDSLDAEGISYVSSADDAIRMVLEGDAEGALLVRPTEIADVYARAQQGQVMPQKTTYFYPKLVSGLLFLPL